MSADPYPLASAAFGTALFLMLATASAVMSKTADACVAADRAVAAQLAPLLDRRDTDDARLVGRAVQSLDRARDDCRYGWTEAALNLYGGLASTIRGYVRTGHWPDD